IIEAFLKTCDLSDDALFVAASAIESHHRMTLAALQAGDGDAEGLAWAVARLQWLRDTVADLLRKPRSRRAFNPEGEPPSKKQTKRRR
ncbi:MAG TPA: hypothetical protein VFL36_04890, partial [Myxococcales bacterium]|nr:hypothetical protein [Myxococcales bacterium]